MSVRAFRILTVAAIAAAPLAAQAADEPVVTPFDAAIANAAHDWSGGYVGVNAGYSLGDFETFTPATGDAEFSGDGALGGFQIGYNKQLGSIVIGVEGDLQAADIDGSGGGTSTSLDWFSTARGRVGYAFDRTLVYGTAGVAAGGLDAQTASGGDSTTAWGLVGGAGVERALTENLTLKAEYLYLDLEDEKLDTGTPDTNAQWDGHIMRFGANLKF